MKAFIVLSVVVAVALARPDGDHYDTKYDDYDVESLVSNQEQLKAFTHCLLGKSSCTDADAGYKEILPEAFATSCSKCTPKQRANIRAVSKAVQQQLPEEWGQLVQLFDPEGKHKESLIKFLTGSD